MLFTNVGDVFNFWPLFDLLTPSSLKLPLWEAIIHFCIRDSVRNPWYQSLFKLLVLKRVRSVVFLGVYYIILRELVAISRLPCFISCDIFAIYSDSFWSNVNLCLSRTLVRVCKKSAVRWLGALWSMFSA